MKITKLFTIFFFLFNYSSSFAGVSCSSYSPPPALCSFKFCKCVWKNQVCSSNNPVECCDESTESQCSYSYKPCYSGGCTGWCGASSRNSAKSCEAPLGSILEPSTKSQIKDDVKSTEQNNISNKINNKKNNVGSKIEPKKDKIKDRIYGTPRKVEPRFFIREGIDKKNGEGND